MDTTFFHAINNLAGHYDGVDDVFEFLSGKGPFLLVALLLGFWFWPGPRRDRDSRQWAGIAATLSACIALGVNQIIIRLWERPRPFITHPAHLLLAPKYDSSFPSDHATVAVAVAVSIALASHRIGIVALVFAALIGFSRVYVGEHYLGDVLAGSLIGAAAAVAVNQLRPWVLPLIDPALRHARRWRLA